MNKVICESATDFSSADNQVKLKLFSDARLNHAYDLLSSWKTECDTAQLGWTLPFHTVSDRMYSFSYCVCRVYCGVSECASEC